MYTAVHRQQVLDDIVRKVGLDERVVSLILVGSGAKGFTDSLSDLDLVAVVEESKVDEVYRDLSDWIAETWAPTHSKLYKHTPEVYVWCCLLPNRLNIDLGIWAENALFASKPHWKILFDRKGSINQKLSDTWNPPSVASFDELAKESISWSWQPVRSAIVAQKRGEYLKADFQIGLLRQEVVKLYAAKAGQVPEDLDREQQAELRRMLGPDLNSIFSSYCGLLIEARIENGPEQVRQLKEIFDELNEARLT